ncbi:insulinase family protein [Chitiniphilus purpureus]|uniref:Insulinase family protein n=1 Tax=Chitiniphilus purpureus TaxID=2981137 RepID=A0ABY6DNU4_9NEIS|nr:pitrilysin family protein [Chitiniphilus sp. CD1]UXY16020.1 insulinase family protein [Chitiniphilus sp. CD1]
MKSKNEQPAAAALPHPLLASTVVQLENGMTVVLHEDHRAPVIELQLWYRIGAVDEPAGLTGISHALEHMMFRGTPNVPAGEYHARVGRLGGQNNAFTTRDYTYYFVTLPSSDLETALQLEADRMQNLTLSETLFATEIEVVKEERRLSTENNAFRAFSEQMQGMVYADSAMRNPVVGHMQDLQRMKVADLRDWYGQWYAPNNAILVLAGDFDPAKARTLIEHHFGGIAKRALPERAAAGQATALKQQRLALKKPSASSLITFQWRLSPDMPPGDLAALDVLAEMLANDYQERRLALASDSLYASFDFPSRTEPSFVFSATPADSASLSELEAAMDNQISLLHGAGLYREMLERAQQRMLARNYFSYDALSNRARELGLLALYGMTPRQYADHLGRMQQVTLQDLERVVKRYLGNERRVVGVLEALPLDQVQAGTSGVVHGH